MHLIQNFNTRRDRIFRDRFNPLDSMREDLFIARYRFSKLVFLHLCEIVQENERQTKRNLPLPVSLQLAVALRFFSQGGYLSKVGDVHHISKATTGKVLDGVCEILSSCLSSYVQYPAHETLQQNFYQYSGFPKVIGCIDGTHVQIKKPANSPMTFMNRKQGCSINVLLVCDVDLSIIYSLVKFPGSCHDSFILNNSALCEKFSNHPPNGWLLGDPGYPSRSWLMTPLSSVKTIQEERYQKMHKKGRNTIERCNGLLKSRFRCLLRKLEFTPEKSCKIIRACIVLHNIAIKTKQTTEAIDLTVLNSENDQDESFPFNDANANNIRNALIENL